MHEVLLSKNERVKSTELEKYFKISADVRSLNYEKYFELGEESNVDTEDYNSANTFQLSVTELANLIKHLDIENLTD
jgi:UDP-glucose 4-epimerase